MDDHPGRRRRVRRPQRPFRRQSGLGLCLVWRGDCGVRPAFFVDSEICLFLEPDEVELSDAALLREFTSKQLADEVLRRIAAGEDDEDE